MLIDDDTFETHRRGETVDPRRYRDVVVRTQTGRRLYLDDAINAALIGHIRRVVDDGSAPSSTSAADNACFAGHHARR